MKHLLTALAAAVTLQLSTAPLVFAQTSPPTAAYTGPRYPGGPDSLRALVYRSSRLANPAPTGKTLVLFELNAAGQPVNFKLVAPPGPTNTPLLKAAATAVDYLQARMLTWQPGIPDPQTRPTAEPPKNSLVLNFDGSALHTRAYSYSEQLPQFPTLAKLLSPQRLQYVTSPLTDPAQRVAYLSTIKGLVMYTQMQARYPPEALRNQQQGQVYASFEVTETGTIEQVEILGTAGRALDAEVLRLVQGLPAAGSPALVQGRPVRVQHVLPITFKIQ